MSLTMTDRFNYSTDRLNTVDIFNNTNASLINNNSLINKNNWKSLLKDKTHRELRQITDSQSEAKIKNVSQVHNLK